MVAPKLIPALLWHAAPAGVLYEVRGRPTAAGTATFFVNLHGLLRSPLRRLFDGQPWISVEVSRAPDAIRYQLWIPDAERTLIERLLRASYSELELVPVQRAVLAAPCVAVADVRLAHGTYLPIRTAHHGEPLGSLLSMLASLTPGQEALLQLLVRPASSSWHGHAALEAQGLRWGRGGPLSSSARARGSSPTRFERDRAKAIEEKARGPGFHCALRIVVGEASASATRELIRSIVATLGVFGAANAFALRAVRGDRWTRSAAEHRAFPRLGSFILTSEELAALWHLPTAEPPQLRGAHPMHLPPPPGADEGERVLGRSTWPGDDRTIGLSVPDSRLHLHLLGPTGSGKTTAMLNLAVQDIVAGRGVGILDPKGDLVASALARIPRSRMDDVVYISPDQGTSCIGINPLELGPNDDPDLVAENTLTIFKRLYERFWGMRTDDILKVALRTMLARGDATLAHIPLLLTDPTFRSEVTSDLDDRFLASFWQWFDDLSDAQRSAAIGPVLNKLRDFLVRPRLRRLLCQVRSTVRLEDVVDSGKILLADLSVGRWGESASELVGSFLLAKIWQSVLARSGRPESERRDFFLYVDEFQQFQGVGNSFADALAQARSLRLSLTLANQNLGQLSREVREAIDANARSKVVFQCGQDDAAHLARTFAPLDASALESLPRFEMAARLVIRGATSPACTLRTLAPTPVGTPLIAEAVRAASLVRYGRSHEAIDRELLSTLRWMGETPSSGGVDT